MKYNNELLNTIYEINNNNKSNTLGLDNIINGYIELMKNGYKIHIKEKNKGKFSASARRAGESVQEHARNIVNDTSATTLQKKRAQFAINAKHFKH